MKRKIDVVLERPVQIFVDCANQGATTEESWLARGERLCRAEGYSRTLVNLAMDMAFQALNDAANREIELRQQIRDLRRTQRAWR